MDHRQARAHHLRETDCISQLLLWPPAPPRAPNAIERLPKRRTQTSLANVGDHSVPHPHVSPHVAAPVDGSGMQRSQSGEAVEKGSEIVRRCLHTLSTANTRLATTENPGSREKRTSTLPLLRRTGPLTLYDRAPNAAAQKRQHPGRPGC